MILLLFCMYYSYEISFDTLYNANVIVILNGFRKIDDYIQIIPFDDFGKVPIKTYVKE